MKLKKFSKRMLVWNENERIDSDTLVNDLMVNIAIFINSMLNICLNLISLLILEIWALFCKF